MAAQQLSTNYAPQISANGGRLQIRMMKLMMVFRHQYNNGFMINGSGAHALEISEVKA